MMGDARAVAIEAARRTLNLEPAVHAEVWDVQWLGGKEREYFLVELGRPGHLIGVAAVSATTGEVMVSASLPGTGGHVALREAEARARVGAEASHARLVWCPSRVTMSPLYPVWAVRSDDGERYVDQRGHVWDALEAAGPGGGSS